MHRVVTDERLLLMLSLQENRVVQPDWTVRWQNGFLQLPCAAAEHVQPGQRVVISSQLDGRLRIFVGDHELAWAAVRDPLAVPRPASQSVRLVRARVRNQRRTILGGVASSLLARPPL